MPVGLPEYEIKSLFDYFVEKRLGGDTGKVIQTEILG